MFVLIFYVLSPIPTFISRRLSDDDSSSNACRELAYFLTTGIVVSAFGLPIVLARNTTVSFLDSCLDSREPCLTAFCERSVKNASRYAKGFIVNVFLPQIQWGACGLVMAGNAVIFLTIFGFFVVFGGGDDFSWEQW